MTDNEIQLHDQTQPDRSVTVTLAEVDGAPVVRFTATYQDPMFFRPPIKVEVNLAETAALVQLLTEAAS